MYNPRALAGRVMMPVPVIDYDEARALFLIDSVYHYAMEARYAMLALAKSGYRIAVAEDGEP